MEFIKKWRASAVVNALLTILIGLLFVINPYGASSTIAVVAGVIIFCNGILDIIRYVKTDGYAYFVRGSLFTGVMKCVLGIFIFSHTDTMLALFSYIFSIFIIINGVTFMENASQLRWAGVNGWMLNMILAVVITVAGVIMLFKPISAASSAAIFVGIILIVNGITELFTIYQLKKIGKEFYRTVKDMKDEIDGNIIDQ